MGDNHEERIRAVEIDMATLSGNVDHIKETLDNHVLSMLREINDKIVGIGPAVRDNSYWIAKLKWGVFWVAAVTVCGGIAKFVFWYG